MEDASAETPCVHPRDEAFLGECSFSRGSSGSRIQVTLSRAAGRADDIVVSDPIRLRYDATCTGCTVPLVAGTYAVYDKSSKTTTCMACLDLGLAADRQGAPVEVLAVAEVPLTIRLRYDSACVDCGTSLTKGSEARWDRAAKSARCLGLCSHLTPASETTPIDLGVAGGSARRIGDRQQAKRDARKAAQEQAIRDAVPVFGGAIVGLRRFFAEPEKPTSYQKGAAGEEAVGRTFARLADDGFVVLHDRRKPGTKWNIDHVVIGPRGVYVIDAKNYTGRLEIRSTGSIFRPGPTRVFVNSRPQDKRVAAMSWQVDAVGEACGDLLEGTGAIIKPVLCFLGVELSLTQQPMLVGADHAVLVTWPRRFVKDIGRDGPLTREQIDTVARRIAEKLPAAVAAPSRSVTEPG